MAKDDTMLAHMVYFTLKDASPAGIKRQVDACRKYLTGHDGTVFFAVGTRTPDLVRDVNDRDYDVALHLVFKTAEDHDVYQTHPRHQEFIKECKPLWKKVRVFDSTLK